MTNSELQDVFVANLELERAKLGYSQKEMAKALGLSHSRYKRIIYREIELHGVLLLAKLYTLTGKDLTDFVGFSDDLLTIGRELRKLSKEDLQAVNTVVRFLLEHQN